MIIRIRLFLHQFANAGRTSSTVNRRKQRELAYVIKRRYNAAYKRSLALAGKPHELE